MPVYEYVSPDGREAILARRAVHERDLPLYHGGATFRRRTVPSRITVGAGAAPETMSQKTWKGYRKLELDGHLRDRPGYLPAETVKRALLAPETD